MRKTIEELKSGFASAITIADKSAYQLLHSDVEIQEIVMNQCKIQTRVQPCCVASAHQPKSGFCGECGNPLLRCKAFEECGGLLDSSGCCPCCFAPEVRLAADCLRRAKVGGSLTIPIIIENGSPTGRTKYVKGIWVREGRGDWRECDLPWDRLEAGTRKSVSLTAQSLDRPGTHRVEILIAIASRWQWQEETFVFSTGLEITVEAEQDLVVQQNIHYNADTPQTGATIYAPVRVAAEQKLPQESGTRVQTLALTRANVHERTFGFRGTENGLSVKRTAEFRWNSFPAFTSPARGMIVNANGLLTFGRSRTVQQNGTTDVRLLVTRKDGGVDEEASREISRDHFCVWIENDRLMLRANSNNGVWVDGDVCSRGKIVELTHGSRFSPLKTSFGRLTLLVEFEVEHQEVVALTISRVA